MEIRRPTANTLLWEERDPPVYGWLLGLVAVVFLAFGGELARATQRYYYQCQRLTPATVQCQRTEYSYLGLSATQQVTIHQVIGVEATVTVTTTDHHRYESHSVEVITPTGPVTLVEPPAMVGGRRGDPHTMGAIAQSIATFLTTTDTHWSHQIWHRDAPINAVTALCLMGFSGLIVAYGWQRQRGITYRLERQPQGMEPPFTVTLPGLWGARAIAFGWSDVVSLAVQRQWVGGGKHRRLVYAPTLTLRHQGALRLGDGRSQLPAEGLVRQIKAFLRGETIPHQVWGDQPQTLERELLQGRQGRYVTTDTPALPVSESPRLRQAGEHLRRQGAQYLGDLQWSKLPGVVAYVYALPRLNSYALLYRSSYYLGADCYSTLTLGGSLTTTSRLVLFLNWGQPPVYFRSHWGVDMATLVQRHHQNLTHLAPRTGGILPLRPTLTACAQAMEDHLRDRRGLLISAFAP